MHAQTVCTRLFLLPLLRTWEWGYPITSEPSKYSKTAALATIIWGITQHKYQQFQMKSSSRGKYCKLPNNMLPLLHTAQMCGYIWAHTPLLPRLLTPKVYHHDECHCFLEVQQLHWTCTIGISGACVDTKSRCIKANCIVSGDSKLVLQVVASEACTMSGGQQTRPVIFCIRIYKNLWQQN